MHLFCVASLFDKRMLRIGRRALINYVSVIFFPSFRLTSMAAAVGAAVIPSAGPVAMLIVLQSANLPTGDVALLWAVDWFM